MNFAVHLRRNSVLRPDVHAMVVLVRGDVELASWPLTEQGGPALDLVDELARLQLAARRLGCSIRLRDASIDLWELLDFLGLAEVVTGVAGLRPEVGGEAEDGEQVGVEEVVETDDPLA
jgi:hypothetical protein